MKINLPACLISNCGSKLFFAHHSCKNAFGFAMAVSYGNCANAQTKSIYLTGMMWLRNEMENSKSVNTKLAKHGQTYSTEIQQLMMFKTFNAQIDNKIKHKHLNKLPASQNPHKQFIIYNSFIKSTKYNTTE